MLGHEAVGTVQEIGSGVSTFAEGEYARVPFAENSVYKVPEQLSDEQVLFLSDILPTAYEVGVLNGRSRQGTSSS